MPRNRCSQVCLGGCWPEVCAKRDAVDRTNAAAARGKRHARKEVIRIEVLCFTISGWA
jgi:hypothetical protein